MSLPGVTRPLRVLHVIDSLCRGGAESMLAAMLHELAASGQCRSFVRAGRVREADPQLVSSVTSDVEQLAFLRSEHVYDPRLVAGLARAIRRHDVDVVHAHLAVASVNSRLAARALGRPHLSTIHTMPGSTLTDTRAWLLADTATARLSALHVAPSQAVADAWARHYRLPARRLRVIPNAPATGPHPAGGAALPVAERDALRREIFGVPEAERGSAVNGPLVLCVARLVPGKGVDELLAAAAMLAERIGDLHVAIAGAGPEYERLRGEVARRGLEPRFRLLGHRPDVERLLTVADVFCLPSRHEAAPVSLLEAMSAGCACVASAVGAIPEMLDSGRCGLLVPPGDAAALAAALERVLGDPSLARSLGDRARDAVRRRYSIESVTAQYVELYRQLARSRRR